MSHHTSRGLFLCLVLAAAACLALQAASPATAPTGPATRPAVPPATAPAAVILLTTRTALPTQPVPPDRPGFPPLNLTDIVPNRIDLPANRQPWQALPAAVDDVYVGPDDRAWYVSRGGFVRLTLDAATRQIEREFGRPDPQLRWLRPALFEPSGRVWFTYTGTASLDLQGGALIGYDGKTWALRQSATESGYPGDCPGHGGYAGQGSNLFVDGVALFVSRGKVDTFDGREWSSRDFRAGANDADAVPRLIPEPDGKGAVAVVRSGDGTRDAAKGVDRVYRYRGGQWSKVYGVPEGAQIRALAPAAGGAWVATGRGWLPGALSWVAYDAGPEQTVDELAAALRDPDPKAREAATNKLIARGPPVADAVRRAMDDPASTPESRNRLQVVLREVARARPADRADTPVRFGPYEVAGIRFLFADGTGRAVVGASRVTRDGEPLAPAAPPAGPDGAAGAAGAAGVVAPAVRTARDAMGVVLADRDGRYVALGGADALALWQHVSGNRTAVPAVAVPGGDRAWTPGDGTAAAGALLDLPTRTIVARLPSAAYDRPLAARRDGTVFVTGGNGMAVMKFDPTAPLDRERLAVSHVIDVSRPTFCNADDGTALAHDRQRGMVRFDGKAWAADPRLAGVGSPTTLVPGRGGAVLAEMDDHYALITKDEVVAADVLEDLVAANAAAFRGGFAGPHRAGFHADNVWVAADGGGNVWVTRFRGRDLKVFAGGKWRDTRDALRAAGALSPAVAFVAGVGDGAAARAYAGDAGDNVVDPARGRAFLGEVAADGTARFTEAPSTASRELPGRAVYDAAGRLWVFGHPPRGDGPPANGPGGLAAIRVGPKGADAEVPDAVPACVDDDGNVWLRARGPTSAAAMIRQGSSATPSDPVLVWRDGRTYDLPPIPPLGDKTYVFPAGKGRVFVWTDLGLQLLTADPADPGRFVAGRLYEVDGVDGKPWKVEASPLGYVAVLTMGSRPGVGTRLYVVPLPQP